MDKSLRWALALGLLAAALVVAGAAALAGRDDAAPSPADAPADDHVMDAHARCAHMPEHCPEARP